MASLNPQLASQWHPTKNGDMTADDLPIGSHNKVWWKCPEGPDHEWPTTPSKRQAQGCPFCGSRRLSVTNSLSAKAPELARWWHPTKNGEVRPQDVMKGSGKKVWWKCPVADDHEWQAPPGNQEATRAKCPFCRNLYVSADNSLESLYPVTAELWHPTKNVDLTPRAVTAHSNKKV